MSHHYQELVNIAIFYRLMDLLDYDLLCIRTCTRNLLVGSSFCSTPCYVYHDRLHVVPGVQDTAGWDFFCDFFCIHLV